MLLEKELINECICGNRAAQKKLYEKYSPLFFAVCRRYMPTLEEAEDVLVMGFMSIFENLDTYKGDGSFEGWMRKIIVNKAINTLRDNSEYYKTEDYDELEQKGKFESKSLNISKMDIKYIMEQIQKLPTKKRIIFNLFAIEGLSYNEISDLLGIAKGTISSQIAGARQTLQKKLQDFNE